MQFHVQATVSISIDCENPG